MQRIEKNNLHMFFKNSYWVGCLLAIAYVGLVLMWSLFDKDSLLEWFKMFTIFEDYFAKIIPIIDKHTFQFTDHGYLFEAARSRNLHSMIWGIESFFFSVTIIFSLINNVELVNSEKINSINTIIVAVGLIIIISVVSYYGVDINFDTIHSRRSYMPHNLSFLYFVQAVGVFMGFVGFIILFDCIRNYIRRAINDNRAN